MSLSRRSFVKTAGAGGVAWLSGDLLAARGREAQTGTSSPLAGARVIKINSNENAYGPGQAALDAARTVLGPAAGRYPANVPDLAAAIAKQFDIRPENVVIGTGSGELIGAAVAAFTTPTRALVQALPTWEDPGRVARRLRTPVRDIAVDAKLRLDIAGMSMAAKGAGLVFFCNPNNPTGTVHSKDAVTRFVQEVLAASPATTILIDEAYYDFVVDPAYATAVPLAVTNPRVVVTRTFSKVHGMAGLRVGYAIGHPDTLKTMAAQASGSMNVLSAAAAAASIQDTGRVAEQRKLTRATLESTARVFADLGFAMSDSQANFILVDVKRPAREFRDACGRMGVIVGRDFPPLTNYARITIGTAEEMRVAADVFRKVLAGPSSTAARP